MQTSLFSYLYSHVAARMATVGNNPQMARFISFKAPTLSACIVAGADLANGQKVTNSPEGLGWYLAASLLSCMDRGAHRETGIELVHHASDLMPRFYAQACAELRTDAVVVLRVITLTGRMEEYIATTRQGFELIFGQQSTDDGQQSSDSIQPPEVINQQSSDNNLQQEIISNTDEVAIPAPVRKPSKPRQPRQKRQERQEPTHQLSIEGLDIETSSNDAQQLSAKDSILFVILVLSFITVAAICFYTDHLVEMVVWPIIIFFLKSRG